MALFLIRNTQGDAKQAYGPFATVTEAKAFLQHLPEGEYVAASAVRVISTSVTKTVAVTKDEVIP